MSAKPETPTTLGKYRVVAKIGQGGMATVWLGLVAGPANFTKLMVIKELRADVAHDPEFLTMFLDEARLAARLNHPNVVHTYEVGSDGDRNFIAMEYLEGQPMHLVLSRVGREKMPLSLHVRILSETLAGLHYAHTLVDFDGTPLSIVHRDVSPQNVFVAYDGHVRIVDFGIAKAAGGMAVTQEGMYKGKVGYMAPEQALAQKIDARADVFSVGVMLWEAIAQKRRVQNLSEAAALHARVLGSEAKIREVVPDAPAALADICDKALAVSPDDRFASAEEMKLALDRWLDGLPEKATSREVGALVTTTFAAEKRAIAAKIEEQVRLIKTASAGEAVPILELVAPQSSGTPSARNLPVAIAVDNEPSTKVAAVAAPARPASGRRLGPVVAGVALALGALGVFALTRRESGDAALPSSASTSAPAPERREVTLSISYGPAGAVATLDGKPIGASPVKLVVPRDTASHTLEVALPGGKPVAQAVSFDHDGAFTLLAPEVAAQASAPASASAKAEPATPASKPGVAAPADTAGKKNPRPIDTSNPYAN